MKRFALLIPLLAASPAAAASGNFFSLANTDFVVTLGFLVFIGVLVYYKVPGLLFGLLDKRALGIKSELDEARAIRDEAQELLARYEREQKKVQEQAKHIVSAAKADAEASAKQAEKDLENTIARRLRAAEDQIASAEAAAVKQVRDKAAAIAVEVAGQVIAKGMSDAKANALIDDAIKQVETKLH